MRIMVISHVGRPADAPTPSGQSPSQAQWNSYASPGTQIDLGNPEPYARPDPNRDSGGTDRPLLWHMSVPALVRKAVWAEQNGYDAIIQSNNYEIGRASCRERVYVLV